MRSPGGISAGATQFTKFAVVGCVNVGLGFAVFMLLYLYFPPVSNLLSATGKWGAHAAHQLARLGVESVDAAVAYTLGAAVGMATSFVLNKHWTFEATGLAGPQFRRFVVLNLLNISASSVIIFVLVDVMQAPYLPVWIAITALAMIVNFVVNKYWTFAAYAPTQPSVNAGPVRASPDGHL